MKGERVEDLQASETWRVFRIQAELIDPNETLNTLGPAVTLFGRARLPVSLPYCLADAQRLIAARRVATAEVDADRSERRGPPRLQLALARPNAGR